MGFCTLDMQAVQLQLCSCVSNLAVSKERIACCVEQRFYCMSGSSQDLTRPSDPSTVTAGYCIASRCSTISVSNTIYYAGTALICNRTQYNAEYTYFSNNSTNPVVCRNTSSQMLVSLWRSPCICLPFTMLKVQQSTSFSQKRPSRVLLEAAHSVKSLFSWQAALD